MRPDLRPKAVKGTEEARAAAAAISDYSDVAAAPSEGSSGHNVASGAVRFINVTFYYPMRGNSEVFQALDLDIQPGQRTAIIGSSGAGKSTLLKLLCRFYDPQEGSILLDGRDIRSFTEKELTKAVAFLPQESQLFPLSIAENIVYGMEKGSYSMEDIVHAAKEANIHDFICSLPDKYMTRWVDGIDTLMLTINATGLMNILRASVLSLCHQCAVVQTR